ncbi:MAG: aryl-sulfate sulfotransferase [Myxococcota bacterium]
MIRAVLAGSVGLTGCLTLAGGLAGCSGSDDPFEPGPGTDTEDPGAGVAFVGAIALSANPNPDAPLAVHLVAETDRPATLAVSVEASGRTWGWDLPEGTVHDRWLDRWRAGEVHHVTVTATAADGSTATSTLDWTAATAPAELSGWTVTSADPAATEPGITVFPISEIQGDAWLVGVDVDGALVYAQHHDLPIREFERLSTGNVAVIADEDGLYEFSPDGAIVAEWHPGLHVPPGAGGVVLDGMGSLHHDFGELPDGSLYALSVDLRTVDGYPTSETDPDAPRVTAQVVGQSVVTFTRDGAVTQTLNLLDVLDPTRIAYDAVVSRYWEEYFTPSVQPRDWGHANAVLYDPTDDTFVVGLRHQDVLVKLSRATGEVVWILAPPANWTPALEALRLQPADGGSFAWLYHQHGPEYGPDGTLFVLDNHNHGASAYEPEPPSVETRAVELRIDDAARTVSEIWSYGDGLGLYASTQGNVQPLPETDHVLVVFGALTGGARLVETTHTTPATEVWRLDLPLPSGTSVFRAKRWD